MELTVKPSTLGGSLSIPPSKSQTLRAIVFAMLAKGKSEIHTYLHSLDTDSMIRACELLGAKIRRIGEVLEIDGNLRPAEDVIDAGNSGIVLRFIGAVAGLIPEYTVITGDDSIRHRRPVKPLLEGLHQLGAFAVSSREDGFAPIIVKGPMKGGTTLIDGEDSQPVSGLLIASAFIPGKTEIFVKNPGELPWIDVTLDWLDRLGIAYENNNYQQYKLNGNSVIEGFSYHVPADWSSIAYPIAAALVTNSELIIEGIDFQDAQGDKKLIELLQEMGARFEIGTSTIRVLKHSSLRGQKIDVSHFIDAITLLPVIACFAEGRTEIVNGRVARTKECDRIRAIATELKKMGAQIDETEDGLIIEKSDLKGAKTKTYADHRMAMSLTVAGLTAKGSTHISGVEAVAKSFPGFFDCFKKLGAQIE